ncbi:MAG: Resolvase domain [Paenibacillus sp.]|jgi:DNA invertase Pin-like site-specific DNA recombinase|nr:Resolvase domain [Paenibacillus sp.]
MQEKAVGYVRVSTYGQVKEGYSLAYQMEEIERYCQQNHLELTGIYADKGLSGAAVDEEELTIEREGLQDMLSDLRAGKAGKVIVLHTSRLWRSDMVKVLIQRELKRQQVEVKSIEQPNYSMYAHEPNDFLVNGMLELLDQFQRLEIALKLSRGRKKKAEQGGYAGGGIPFGYKSNKRNKSIEVDWEHAIVIQRLYELKELFPHWSLGQFAKQLNYDGHRTAQGKLFHSMQIKRMLDREDFYSGLYRYGNVTARGQYAAIL